MLVSCVKTKAGRELAAKELYVSDWFVKARALVERSGLDWFILSAEHGLVGVDDVIAPYERTLNRMPVAERRAWAEKVVGQMEKRLPDADEVIILAGKRYRENLMRYLCNRFRKVTVPMEGLTSGRQLRWLGNAAGL